VIPYEPQNPMTLEQRIERQFIAPKMKFDTIYEEYLDK